MKKIGNYLLNNTANPAQYGWKSTGLASSLIFFLLNNLFFIYFIRYEKHWDPAYLHIFDTYFFNPGISGRNI